MLKAEQRDDTNSLAEPKKVVPATEKVDGLGTGFTREFPPYSITILELKRSKINQPPGTLNNHWCLGG